MAEKEEPESEWPLHGAENLDEWAAAWRHDGRRVVGYVDYGEIVGAIENRSS